MFEGMGFGLFDDMSPDGLTPTTQQAKKAAKKEKTSVKKGSKPSKALTVQMEKPVTVHARNFTHVIDGEGNLSLQDVVAELVNAGYDEAKHKNMRFVKVTEHLLLVNHHGKATDGNIKLELPVTLCDGMMKAVYEKAQDLGVDADDADEITVKELCAAYQNKDIVLDYDITSGTAYPVYPLLQETEYGQIKAGDSLVVHGEKVIVADNADIIGDYIGELPENCRAVIEKICDGEYYLHLAPVKGFNGVSIEREALGCNTGKKARIVEEKITCPFTVYMANVGQTLSYTEEIFDGKGKITWEELFDRLKKDIPFLRSVDRPLDHWYDRDNNRVACSFSSGKKGQCLAKTSCFAVEDDRFVMLKQIPMSVFCEIVNYFAENLKEERIVQIWYEQGVYKIIKPCEERATKSAISYRFRVDIPGEYVCTIHSHNTMPPFFSCVDNADEIAIPGLYGVIGNIRKKGQVIFFSSVFRFTRGCGQSPIMISLEEIANEE